MEFLHEACGGDRTSIDPAETFEGGEHFVRRWLHGQSLEILDELADRLRSSACQDVAMPGA